MKPSFLSVGGIRQHLVAIAVDDKKTHDWATLNLVTAPSITLRGHRIVLTKDGVIKIACKRLEVVAEDEILFDSPQTRFTGDVDIVGISQASDHLSGGISGANHIHPEHDGYSSGGPKA
ncbi:hypothetical protein ACFFW8_25195 [Erwinia tracheiphila]